MKLRVQYTAQLRAAIGRPEEEIDLPDGSSLEALLDHLVSQQGAAAATHLVTSSGEIRSSLLIVVNGTAMPVHSAAERQLKEGDVVLLLPPIAGG
jgi:molybdopterin synthase sulfur carrier subunit